MKNMNMTDNELRDNCEIEVVKNLGAADTIRVTHIPTGTVAESCEHSTQPLNLKAALTKLAEHLIIVGI